MFVINDQLVRDHVEQLIRDGHRAAEATRAARAARTARSQRAAHHRA